MTHLWQLTILIAVVALAIPAVAAQPIEISSNDDIPTKLRKFLSLDDEGRLIVKDLKVKREGKRAVLSRGGERIGSVFLRVGGGSPEPQADYEMPSSDVYTIGSEPEIKMGYQDGHTTLSKGQVDGIICIELERP